MGKNIKKLSFGEPVLIAQSSEDAILWGGFQLTDIRCDKDKNLYVKFFARRDSFDTRGKENLDPVYKSDDAGKTWTLSDKTAWYKAAEVLPNGDRITFGENPLISNIEKTPETPEDRTLYNGMKAYTIDEVVKSGIAKPEKSFRCYRVYAGDDKVTEESCQINWKNMTVLYNEDGKYLVMQTPECGYKVDKYGRIWMTMFGAAFDDEGCILNNKYHTHLLRSDDFGHTFDYVSTVEYKEEYNHEKSLKVEGFSEAAMEVLDDGSIVLIVRTGSLSPIEISTDENPLPILYIVRSTDGGKTWSEPEKFHDYGIRPRSVMLVDGTIVMISGRPGIFLKYSKDESGMCWSEAQEFMTVPKEDVYGAYYEYSCYNSALCVYDEKTLFMSYSDFKRNTPDGKRAKSIMVAKITVV